MPAQHDLSWRLTVPTPDLDQSRIVEAALLAASVGGYAADRRPCLGEDAVLGVQCLQFLLLEVGVQFDLVDGRNHGDCVE